MDANSADSATPATRLSPWALVIGPCYTVESFAGAAQMTVNEVARAADELRLLRLTTADGVGLLPMFQLRDGIVAPRLGPILRALQRGIDDPWTWALWLNARLEDEAPAIEALWAGEYMRVLSHARHDAWAWQQ